MTSKKAISCTFMHRSRLNVKSSADNPKSRADNHNPKSRADNPKSHADNPKSRLIMEKPIELTTILYRPAILFRLLYE
jgi:hypothetical protein